MEDRYTRIEALGWSRKILSQATALVVGAGALGNEALKNLALVGFGNIILIDLDDIENHNLTRSILFRASDIGKSKAEIAAKTVQEIDPNCRVSWFKGKVQEVIGLGIFRRVDFVLGCLDNIQTRIDINRLCMQANTPYIDGGLHGILGKVKVFAPPFDVCFDCGLSEQNRQDAETRWQCLKLRDRHRDDDRPTGPTAPTISSMVAGLQVQIGLKIIHQHLRQPNYEPGQIPVNKVIEFNGYIDDYDTYKLSSNPNCPSHDERFSDINIISAPKPSTEMTLGELMSFLHGLSEMADASLDIGYEFVDSLTNSAGDIEYVFCRKNNMYVDEIIDKERATYRCQQCALDLTSWYFPEGKFQSFNVYCPDCQTGNSLPQKIMNVKQQFSGQEPYLDKTLASLGFPLGHIVIGKKSNLEEETIRYVAIEFTEDMNIVFTGMPIPQPH